MQLSPWRTSSWTTLLGGGSLLGRTGRSRERWHRDGRCAGQTSGTSRWPGRYSAICMRSGLLRMTRRCVRPPWGKGSRRPEESQSASSACSQRQVDSLTHDTCDGIVRCVSWTVASTIPPRFGAVAQLGERLNGIQEVRGSTPLGSTKLKTMKPAARKGGGFRLGEPQSRETRLWKVTSSGLSKVVAEEGTSSRTCLPSASSGRSVARRKRREVVPPGSAPCAVGEGCVGDHRAGNGTGKSQKNKKVARAHRATL